MRGGLVRDHGGLPLRRVGFAMRLPGFLSFCNEGQE